MIWFGPGKWSLTTSSGSGFQVPSNTIIAGAGRDATSIIWNDAGASASTAVNNNLFSADLSVGNAAQNITFQNFNVTGSWSANGTVQSGSGGYPFLPYNVTNLTFDHVGSYYARLMAFAPRQSSNVIFTSDLVNIAGRDGINTSSCSNVTIAGNVILHTDDDGIATHSATSDPLGGARRDVTVVGNYLLDTEGIHALSARTALISGNTISWPRYHGIDINSVYATNQSGIEEGEAAGLSIIITNNNITDVINRYYLDNLVSGADYIQIDGESARPGPYGAIPGTPAPPGTTSEAVGTIHSPYPEENANSPSTSVATNGMEGVLIEGNNLIRTLPPTDGSVTNSTGTNYTTWSQLDLGNIYTRSSNPSGVNPSLPDAAFRGDGIQMFGGVEADVRILNNNIVGLYNGLELGSNGTNYGTINFRGNVIRDMTNAGILIDANPSTMKGILEADDNDFDLDPYHTGSGRALSGSWSSSTSGPIGIKTAQTAATDLSIVVRRNSFRNVLQDTNYAPGALPGGTGYLGPSLFLNNVDYWQPSVLDIYSASNKGIGFGHTVGFSHVILDSDPTSATYDTILFSPPEGGAAVPTTGTWVAGTQVRNTMPSSANPAAFFVRQTTGSSNVFGTDWIAVYGSDALESRNYSTGTVTIGGILATTGNLSIGVNKSAVFTDSTTNAVSYIYQNSAGQMSSVQYSSQANGNAQITSGWLFQEVTEQSRPVDTLAVSHTFGLSDCGTYIRDTDATAHTDTLPTGLPVGCTIDVVQAGVGLITFAGGSGETLEQTGSGTLTHAMTGKFAKAQVVVDSASTFLLSGQVQ